jgi:pimeloyl-ACP methyl ester carboxylesterase
VLLISDFPQTRRSWNKIVALLSKDFRTVTADLPSFGESGLLTAPATTEHIGRIFHEFAASLGTPLHIVAHDFGAWVAYSWALLFPDDFKSLTLIDAGMRGASSSIGQYATAGGGVKLARKQHKGLLGERRQRRRE